MSAEHIHLLLNHGPIFAVVFSIPLVLFGFLRRNDTVSRVGLVGFVVAALLTIPVYLTGEDAEHAVEDLPGVSHDLIEEHEEAAELTLWLVEGLGVASLLVLFIAGKQPKMPPAFLIVIALLATGVAVSIANTNNIGGQIRHTEIRPGGATGGTINEGIRQNENEGAEDSH